jgi:hypothetical protein
MSDRTEGHDRDERINAADLGHDGRIVCLGCGNKVLGYCEVCGARKRRAALRHKTRTCIVCKAAFTTTRTDAKFCSSACRQRRYRLALQKDMGCQKTHAYP